MALSFRSMRRNPSSQPLSACEASGGGLSEGAFHVVQYRQHPKDDLGSSVAYQFLAILIGALAVVDEVCLGPLGQGFELRLFPLCLLQYCLEPLLLGGLRAGRKDATGGESPRRPGRPG